MGRRGKEVRDMIRELERQGYSVEMAKSGHWKVRDPEGRLIGTLPNTPSDWRSLRNAKALLRRAGVRWPEEREDRKE